MVIDYNSVKIEFLKHGNRLHHVIIDYISEIVKSVSHGNLLQLVIIDYISVKHVPSKKHVIDYNSQCNRLSRRNIFRKHFDNWLLGIDNRLHCIILIEISISKHL